MRIPQTETSEILSKIGVLGDTHGNTSWALYALNKFHREGITKIIQVGDFGLYDTQSGHGFLKRLNLLASQYGQTIYVTPGNHEDYDYINKLEESTVEPGWLHVRSNILVAPRGHRWEWDEKSFVSLGGAPSVDRAWRVAVQGPKRTHWWAEEAITPEDVALTIAGGYADVMVGHDAPFAPSIQERIKGNPHGFRKDDLDYAYAGRVLMDEAFVGVKPKVFLHGHYHFPVFETVNDALIAGLNCDGSNYSLGALDTDTLDVAIWDIERDYTLYVGGNKLDK